MAKRPPSFADKLELDLGAKPPSALSAAAMAELVRAFQEAHAVIESPHLRKQKWRKPADQFENHEVGQAKERAFERMEKIEAKESKRLAERGPVSANAQALEIAESLKKIRAVVAWLHEHGLNFEIREAEDDYEARKDEYETDD